MAIPENHHKVIDLAAYRHKRLVYYEPVPETVCTGDNIEELIRQGRYCGTYTPQAPYGRRNHAYPINTGSSDSAGPRDHRAEHTTTIENP